MINKIFIILILVATCLSQGINDYSFNTPESASMAGAIVASEGGNWSLYNNPATLIDVEKRQLSLGYSNLYNQSYLPLSSYGMIMPTKYGFNLGVKYIGFDVEYQDVELLSESIVGIVGSINLLKDKNSTLSFGVSLNRHKIKFGKSAGSSGDGTNGISASSMNSSSLDIGFLASLREKYRVGVFIKNINSSSIGNGISSQILPRKIDIGFTALPFDYLMVSFSMEQLLGYESPQFRSSVRYRLNRILYLNAGIQTNPNRLGLGFILKNKKISLSYGYLTHHILPGTHQSSIGFSF